MTVKITHSGCTCDMCKYFTLEGIEGVCTYFREVIENVPECCTAFEYRGEEND